jgi:N-acylneuraminate cytidylyltransferase
LSCRLLDGVIVNSDDDNMLEIARRLGCETVKRDPFYASSSAPMSEVYRNMAGQCDCDVIVYANVTNPLLKDETLESVIDFYLNNNDKYDSVNTAHLIKEFLFKENKPINYDLKHQPRSQDLPDIYALNFAVSVISKAQMIEGMNVVGNTPYIYPIDEIEATDIDNPIDFEFAEFVYKARRKGEI